MKLSALTQEYLESLIERKVSPLTYRDYRHYLNRFLDFVSDVEVDAINFQTLADYKAYLSTYVDQISGLSLKRTTQNYLLIALRSLLGYANQRNLAKLDKDSITLSKIKSDGVILADKKDLDRLLNLPDIHTKQGLRDRAILETLLSTGLLVSEISLLNRGQIDLVTKEIIVNKESINERKIYLFDRAAYWLDRYLNSREDAFTPVFIRFQGKTDSYQFGERMRLTPRSIERSVEKYTRCLGLRGKITPQTFRNFLTYGLIKEGVAPKTVQQVMGFQSGFPTTQHTKNLNDREAKNV